MKEKNKQKPNYYIIVFLIVFLPKLICCFMAHPVSIASDEVATMSAGAYVAGLDWSAVVSNAGYYGGGMSIFTAPIYWLTDNPVIIYRAVGIYCAVLQSIPACISYYVTRKYYKIKELSAVLISIACGFFVMAEAHVIFNENGLILISWIIMLLIYKLHSADENKKKKVILTCALMLIMAYSITVHERAVTYWIVFGILLIYYRLTYSKWLVSLPAMFLSAGCGWYGARSFVKWIQEVLWLVSDGRGLRNASISIGGGIEVLNLMTDVRAWASIVLGQIHTIGVFTCGLSFLLICTYVSVMFKFLFSKKYREKLKLDEMWNISIPIIVFFLCAVAITIAGQSISWLWNSIEVYANGYQSQLYGVKGFTYIRYFGIYCGPLLMIGMALIVKRKETIANYFKYAVGLMILVEIYWLINIVPYIHGCKEWGVFLYYYPFTWHSPLNSARYLAFLPASFIMFAIFGLSCFLIYKKKKDICFVLIILSFINAYLYHAFISDRINADISFEWADDGYCIVKLLEDKISLPEVIYVEDLWEKSDHYNYYVYQLLLNRYTIIPERPTEDVEEAILFSNGNPKECYYDELYKQGYKWAEIGEYELIFVKGESLQMAFETAGVELLSE